MSLAGLVRASSRARLVGQGDVRPLRSADTTDAVHAEHSDLTGWYNTAAKNNLLMRLATNPLIPRRVMSADQAAAAEPRREKAPPLPSTGHAFDRALQALEPHGAAEDAR